MHNSRIAGSSPDRGAVETRRVDELRFWVNDKLDPFFILINMTFS